MNPVYQLTVIAQKDLDVSTIIHSQDCASATECKAKMKALILSKHPTYWKRVHRITAQFQSTTLILDPREVLEFEMVKA